MNKNFQRAEAHYEYLYCLDSKSAKVDPGSPLSFEAFVAGYFMRLAGLPKPLFGEETPKINAFLRGYRCAGQPLPSEVQKALDKAEPKCTS